MSKGQKVAAWIVGGFLVIGVLNHPKESGDKAQSGINKIQELGSNSYVFVDSATN